MEFILPSGVVLTSFGPSFVPVLGFMDEIGVEDDNRYEAREYADDFYKEQTDSLLGARAPFTTRIKITGPADFTLNSVGIKVERDESQGGRRTAVWESDHPVSFFNVVGGRVGRAGAARARRSTTIPAIPTTSTRCSQSLDAARKYFSDGFILTPGTS